MAINLDFTDAYKRSFSLFCSRINIIVGKMHLEIVDRLESRDKNLCVKAARGHSKCVCGDTKVLLSDSSTITVRELLSDCNKEIYSLDVNTFKLAKDRIVAVNYNGVMPVYLLKTNSGRKIKVTNNHPFYTVDGWKECKHLNKGDFIAIPRYIPSNNNQELSVNDAMFAGFMIGDGGITDSVRFTNSDLKLIEVFTHVVNSIGGNVRNIRNIEYTITGKHIGTDLHFKKWLSSIGVAGSSHQKRAPPKLFSCSKEIISAFLGAYWSCDGTINLCRNGSLSATTVNEELALDIQSLLLRLNIISSVKHYTLKYKQREVDFYNIIVTGRDNLISFYNQIKLYGAKNDKFKELIDTVYPIIANTNTDVVPLELLKLRFGNKVKGIAFNGKYGCSRDKCKKLSMVDGFSEVNKFAESDVFWDRVMSIDYIGEEETYDLQTEKFSNFIANDIITHNSTIMSIAYPLWVCYKAEKPMYVIIVSMNQDESRRILGVIRNTIEQYNDFLNFVLVKDSADEIQIQFKDTKTYSTICCIPIGTRGRHGDILISDDILKDEYGETAQNMEKVKRIWWNSHAPMINAKKGIILYLGTPISDNDMFDDIQKIIRKETEATGDSSWRYLEYPALKEDGTPQFPEYYTIEELNRIRSSVPDWVWAQEYMLHTYGGSQSIFKISDLENASRLPYKEVNDSNKKFQSFYMGCDIALSGASSADYSAFVVVSKSPDNPIKVEYIWHERGVSEKDQIDEIKNLKRIYGITLGRIEKKGISESMANCVLTDPELAGVMEDWNPTNEEKAKIIGNLQLLIKHNMLYIPDTVPHYSELISELMSFTLVNKNGNQTFKASTGHDDLVIGLALAVSAAGGWVYEERPIYKLQLI